MRDLLYSLRAVRRVPVADIIVTNTFWAPLLLPRRRGAVCVDVQRMPRGQMRLYRRAARIRANSSAVAAAILAEAPRLAGRLHIIPNPLSFVPVGGPAWADKRKTVLFAGRLHPEKGVELLLQAWASRLPNMLADWRLCLVGPSRISAGGAGEEWVESLRRRYSGADIAWLPPVYDEEELGRIYAAATVFAYPSLAERGETFGLAVLEAMAGGAVPVVSDLTCFRDFIDSGRNGLVFDHRSVNPVDALRHALIAAAAPGARAMAERAVSVRVSHAPEAIAEQFLIDFARLTSKPASRDC